MSNIDVGNKRICAGCGARFYDLGKNPVPCPKCRVMNDIKAPVKIRRKSKAAAQIDSDDPLVKQKAKQDARNKPKKPSKVVDDLEDFEYAPIDDEDKIEELDEIDDIETLDELEDAEPVDAMDDDIALDDESIGDEAILDDVEEVEEADEEEEAPAPTPPRKPTKTKR